MRSQEEIERFFEAELLPELRTRQRDGRGASGADGHSSLAAPAGAVLPAKRQLAIVAVGFVLDGALGLFPGVTVLALGLAFWSQLRGLGSRTPQPRLDVKREFIGRIVAFLDPNFSYRPEAGLPEELLTGSGLWEAPYDSYCGEDCISGKQGPTSFQVCEARIAKRYGKKEKLLFRGLFFVADFNKEFRSRTLVLPDRSERHVGLFGRALQNLPLMGQGALVQLENPDFERHFKVYSEDALEARYLLSTSFMKRLTAFRELLNAPVRMAFADGRIHVLIANEQDLLRPVALGQLDAARLRAWLGELLFLTSFVEEFDLENRLWSKRDTAASPVRASHAALASVTPSAGERRAQPSRFSPGSVLRNAVEGHLPLLHTWFLFPVAGGMIVGQIATGLLPGAVATAAVVLYGLPAQYLVWRNADNCASPLWTLLARIGAGLYALAVLAGLASAIAGSSA